MNLSNRPLIFCACLLFAAIICLASGCVPIPHTTLRSPEIRGHVIDAVTHAPIQGAKVYLRQSPHHTIYTDANGYFDLEETRNFHWAYNDGGGLPDNKDNYIEISHTNYVSYGFFDILGGNAGDIVLKPNG